MTVTSYLLIAIAALIIFSFLFGNQKKNFQEIDSEELKQMMKTKDVKLVDVRSKREMLAGVIGQPLKIELSGSFGNEVQKLNRNEKYVVYCRSGRRSAMASNMMTKLGFKQVYNLKGGYNAWTP